MAIVKNDRGGWSIAIYGRLVGNYPTRADALRVAKLNGYGRRILREKRAALATN